MDLKQALEALVAEYFPDGKPADPYNEGNILLNEAWTVVRDWLTEAPDEG